jgi:putative membrane protein insertion efficiency factor
MTMRAKDIVVAIIKFYRKYLSNMKLRCCRFYPSCSEYAVEAIEKHGILSGGLKAIKRVLRCHPFSEGGYDPVA